MAQSNIHPCSIIEQMASKNYAFIDGNNLYLGTKVQDINLDYGKLRKYLRNKFDVEKVFLFIGYDPPQYYALFNFTNPWLYINF